MVATVLCSSSLCVSRVRAQPCSLLPLCPMAAFASRVRELGKASRCLSKQEVAECQKLAEIIKTHMLTSAKDVIASSGMAPILLVYQSDPTPLRTKVIFTSKDDSGAQVRRSGFQCHEYLLQCGFMATGGPGPGPSQWAILAEPISVPNKLAWTLFAACKQYFLPLLKSLKAQGICVTAYVYDRAQFSSPGPTMSTKT